MKKSDLYELAIKILGLYLVVLIIGQLRDILVYLTILLQSKSAPHVLGDFDQTPAFLVSLLGFIVLTIFSGLLIFKTKQITKLVCKPRDYEESISLFAEKEAIYEIALVLVGLVTIVLTLPDFIFKLRNHITLVQANLPIKDNDTTFLITSGLKIIVGLLAILYASRVSRLMTKKKNDNLTNK
jgi:hypothetical protein